MQADANIPLYEFLRRSGASIRAVNATHAAGVSLSEYFDDREKFTQRLMKMPNLGRKTCAEILEVIEKGIELGDIEAIASEYNTRIEKLRDMDLNAFLEANGATIRALNATIGSCFKVSDYLDNPGEFRVNLKKRSKIDYGTITEIIYLIEAKIKDARSIRSQIGYVSREIPRAEKQHTSTTQTLEERIISICKENLPERTRDVIFMRGAIELDKAKTLEEIASLQRVTRERIRQIEKKGKRVISDAIKLYQDEIREAWLQFAPLERYGLAVTEHEIKSLWKVTPVYLKLALFCRDINPAEIMEEVYDRYGTGWLLNKELRNVAKSIHQILSTRSPDDFPVPITNLSKELGASVEEISAVLKLHKEFQEYRGYLLKRPSFRRKRRSVILHQVLARLRGKGPCPLVVLLRGYQAEQTGIPCSSRDALVVMAEQGKSLFLNCYEYGWFPLPPYPQSESTSDFPVIQRATEVEELELDDVDDLSSSGDDVVTIEDQLAEILTDGPMPFDELRETFFKKDHSWARASVGPVLINSDRFVRVAPGIYALADRANNRETIERGEEILLSDKQCKLYCQARWAGEPSILYPYWGTNMELRWAMLLAEQGDKMLFSSLMAVAAVDEWHISDERKAYWRQRKTAASMYLLEEPPGELDLSAYSARQVVAAAVEGLYEGRTSWMSCNRSTGKRVDDRHACSLLGLLIRLGVVQGAKHWQLNHKITNQAADIVDCMLDILAGQPDISLQEFVIKLGANSQLRHEESWFESARIKRDVEPLGEVPKSSIPEFQSNTNPPDVSAQILRMRRRRRI